jgi:hypothetical protein
MSGGFSPLAFSSTVFAVAPIALNSEAYARMLRALLPPGRVWSVELDAVTQSLLLASADELARVEVRAVDLVNEANPSTAAELLVDYERDLNLESTGELEERSARVIARLVRRQRFRPADLQAALAPLLGQDPEDVVVLERTHAAAAALGDDREIYRFFVYRDPSLPGSYFVASAQALVDSMKPSHTAGHVIESISALYDDPHSLYDRDLLGA